MTFPDRFGPWALVMGGSEGLGFALAGELARRGMNLILAARRPDVLEAAAAQLRTVAGVEVRTLRCDAGNPDIVGIVERAIDGLEIGFLIYNCAAEHGGEFLSLSTAEHLDNIAVNCVAPTLLVHALGRRMIERRRGGVVICSSLAAMQGLYRWVSYGAAKSYEMLLGEGLWDELGMHGVDACTFMIGSTYTPNFIKGQVARGTIYAKGRVPENAPPGLQLPQLPEEAAANLFAVLDGKWPPMVFANPLDEARHARTKHEDRAVVIKRMGDMQRSGYRSAMQDAAAQ